MNRFQIWRLICDDSFWPESASCDRPRWVVNSLAPDVARRCKDAHVTADSTSSASDTRKQRVHGLDIPKQLIGMCYGTLLAGRMRMRAHIATASIVKPLYFTEVLFLHSHHAVKAAY